MPEKWRLIDTGLQDAFYNMALDEAMTVARYKDIVPNTLRFFRWNPSAISIGYFQSMTDEVDIDVCKSKGIDYVRRRTGGGAVYHDREGELTYSLIISENHRLISPDFQITYETLCSGIVEGLKRLMIPAEFKPINDITAGGRKLGKRSNARLNTVHQHGTILREIDPELMFKVLKVNDSKIRDKLIKSAKERVTSTNLFLERCVSFKELRQALLDGFEQIFKIELIPSEITNFERELALQLKKDKYATSKWNFKR